MLNNNEEEKKIKKLKIEEIELNPERNEFENELRKNFSKEDVSHYFEVLNDNKILSWENKLFESKLPIRDFSGITDADILINAELGNNLQVYSCLAHQSANNSNTGMFKIREMR